MSGIYFHIPFCKQACNYCDFHFSTNLNSKTEVLNALLKEIDLRHNYLNDKKLESIYFGGGTPSLLNAAELGTLIETIKKYFNFDTRCEITLEANPDDISLETLKAWLKIGINRLSIGLQSFNEDELKWMNRAHTALESEASVKMAQDAGFENISIDLIYGSKFQNLKSWENTLNKAVALRTQHISAYNLTIEGKTRLNNQVFKGLEPEVDEHLSSSQFEMMLAVFSNNSFEQYEISNFAQNNFIAVHNTNYWFQKPYLGLGPSAHSYDGKSRQWNVKNNQLYIKNINLKSGYFEIENLSQTDLFNEFVLTRLRTKWGINVKEIESLFGEKVLKHCLNKVKSKTIYFTQKEDCFVLNTHGRLMADGIASSLFLTK